MRAEVRQLRAGGATLTRITSVMTPQGLGEDYGMYRVLSRAGGQQEARAGCSSVDDVPKALRSIPDKLRSTILIPI
jgi:hypothetical protein